MGVSQRLRIAAMVLFVAGGWAAGQEVVDRIVARVDTDIILLSDVRTLGEYQSLLDEKTESDAQILDRLIDQWIVRTEAKAALFPQPSDAEVQRSLERLQRSFSSPQAFEERKKQTGLSDEELLRMVRSQLYLSNYLDSRFRSSTHVEDQQIEEFYKTRLVPRAEARGQAPPTLQAARPFIQEALVQKAINEQADRWLKESRGRLKVENLLDENGK